MTDHFSQIRKRVRLSQPMVSSTEDIVKKTDKILGSLSSKFDEISDSRLIMCWAVVFCHIEEQDSSIDITSEKLVKVSLRIAKDIIH